MSNNPIIRYTSLPADVTAFSTTRHGGCSRGNYASLNCTSYTGDDADCVRRNREILCNALPQRPRELVIPFQTHETTALAIGDAYLQASDEERQAMLRGIDVLVTREPGVCICISTADCIPILLYDKQHRTVAAIHAGWRGTVNRIVLRTLERMHALYDTDGRDVSAVIGPGISLPAFEVGEEVYEAFRKQGFPMEYISEWNPATHKHHIDLWAANRLQLQDFGVPPEQVETAGICTYSRYEDFFSARRMGIRSGRILSGIMMKEETVRPWL